MERSDSPVYLDFAAATPLDERVLHAMSPYLTDRFYNPSGAYATARDVKAAVAEARTTIARQLGCKTDELIFTAGATESINLAVWGVLGGVSEGHAVTAATEHTAVLAAVSRHAHTIVAVASTTGMVNLDVLRGCITDATRLITIGYANGEIGTIQSIRSIARLVGEVRHERLCRGVSTPLYFHTDASQAAGLLDLHVDRLGIDLMTLNASKCYGPKQVGLLYVRSPLQLAPLIVGGGQEAGLRSGTENVAGIIGFATALQLAEQHRDAESARLQSLRDKLETELKKEFPDAVVSGHPKKRLPSILHIAWPDVDGERLLFALDERGIMVATGSACAANKGTRSHVLEAIGLDDRVADGSIRLSLGRQTDEQQIERAIEAIIDAVRTERSI